MKQTNLKKILNTAKGMIKYDLILPEMKNMNVYEIAKWLKYKFIEDRYIIIK